MARQVTSPSTARATMATIRVRKVGREKRRPAKKIISKCLKWSAEERTFKK